MTFLFLVKHEGQWLATSRYGRLVTTDKTLEGSPQIIVGQNFSAPTVDLLDGLPGPQ